MLQSLAVGEAIPATRRLEGKAPAREIEQDLQRRVERLRASGLRAPALGVVLVGGDPTTIRHAALKVSACQRLGMECELLSLAARASTAEVLEEIDRLNALPAIDGVFLQHPVPPQVDERACFDRIAPTKDVGGDASASFGALVSGSPAFPAVTAAAIVRLLRHYGIPLQGREALVIGRSPMVGKPVAVLLLAADATVTVAHSRTPELPALVARAELIIAALGRREFVRCDWIRPGAVVVDAGYHPGGVGDVELAALDHRAAAFTPVPGGVGPMTLALLLAHTVEAAERAVAS
jgi:methylenetetrahydrofolate dehydrogenase (NADP+)/methenyltetrahydrofolate cyclohydrolase